MDCVLGSVLVYCDRTNIDTVASPCRRFLSSVKLNPCSCLCRVAHVNRLIGFIAVSHRLHKTLIVSKPSGGDSDEQDRGSGPDDSPGHYLSLSWNTLYTYDTLKPKYVLRLNLSCQKEI